ncbi:hypothetical protein EGW08_019991 [Elysia chlorotica]|uniref:Uncharacterized protein n=1 Tax=Elysia chlorotica TaxID=188477 RepID=A0A3S1B0Z3_ELYCH|nr:hypothetical protein EGW08_019991 [Elysia chlorotica]
MITAITEFPHQTEKQALESVEVTTSGDEEQDEKQIYRTLQELFQQFQETATIHGVAKTSQPQLYSCRRLIWAILVVAMTVMLGITLAELITEMRERPIKTNNKFSLHDELPFPAVTICSLNQYIRDRVPDNPMIRHLLYFKSEYARMTGATLNLLDTHVNLTDVSGVDLDNATEYAATRLDELLWGCAWKSRPVDCQQIFQPVKTSYGKCFMFNGDKNNVRVAKMNGPGESLTARISINDDKGFFSQFMEEGVITIRLPYPYKAFNNGFCEDTESEDYVNKLSIMPLYSVTACQINCYMDFVFKQCGCLGFNDLGNMSVCSAKEYFTCYLPAAAKFNQSQLLACNCMEVCHSVNYETEVYYADFASRFSQEIAKNDNSTNANKIKANAIELRIFYKSLNIETLEQQPAISTADIIGKLGGQMGLFLGLSLLSYVEILELFFLMILNYCRACKRFLSYKVKPKATNKQNPQNSQAPVKSMLIFRSRNE